MGKLDLQSLEFCQCAHQCLCVRGQMDVRSYFILCWSFPNWLVHSLHFLHLRGRSRALYFPGWADFDFGRQNGVGDSPDSYAYDGKRQCKWNCSQETYGEVSDTGSDVCLWKGRTDERVVVVGSGWCDWILYWSRSEHDHVLSEWKESGSGLW